ncbi:hypothetical protein Glove_199g52 [Diversispora epigaea]|uniref:Uncharacterized protein n=1 Tax=Diversispora epigaea TaxID=1348612 RepID=A0A397IMS8_9GLOM|nr:hypothetical protein Glove_199g52 [Diversispora epigaea]
MFQEDSLQFSDIQKLERWLKESEKHIAYLENQIGIKDEEIDLLKTKVDNLKLRLKKALQDIENKDKIIPTLETQLIKMVNKLSFLQHRIQKLRETTILDMTHLLSTNTLVFNLILDVRANIKLLGDLAREDNTLLKDEIDNFQTQAELKLSQIQNGCYTFETEVTQLRQEFINLRNINLNQQELTNELGTINETLKEQLDVLTDKNETFQAEMNEKTRLYEQAQDRLDECRDENYQLRESLQGTHENIIESESAYDKLKQKICILGLTHIAWRARNLRQAQILNIEFNTAKTAWRNQRNRNQNITQELQNYRRHGRNLQNDKEPPIEYYNKFMQIFQYGNTLGVSGFNDAVKTQMLSSRLAKRFIPPNPFQNNAGNQVNTPTLFLGWLEDKYREVIIGTSQASMKAHINEKFSPLDIPDSYK